MRLSTPSSPALRYTEGRRADCLASPDKEQLHAHE